MKVQGTEPVVMAKVIDLTARQVVKDTKRTAIDMNYQTGREDSVPEQESDSPPTDSEAIERLNHAMRALSTRLKFEKHEASGDFMVRVINEETDEVIREIPPERVLEMLVHLRQLVGVLVDERA